jgi:hypothetical protein
MTRTDAVEIARLRHKADVIGRLAYQLAAHGEPNAARRARTLRASQYARIRAITAQ